MAPASNQSRAKSGALGFGFALFIVALVVANVWQARTAGADGASDRVRDFAKMTLRVWPGRPLAEASSAPTDPSGPVTADADAYPATASLRVRATP